MQPRVSAGRLLTLAAVTAALALSTGGVAAAAPAGGAPVDGSLSLTGPVGIGAIALGVLGMLTGLIRHRRKATAGRAATEQRTVPTMAPVQQPRRAPRPARPAQGRQDRVVGRPASAPRR